MARTPLVAANWKMYKTITESVRFVEEFMPMVRNFDGVDIVLCPPFISLPVLNEKLQGSAIHLGAQNMYWETDGAYTGEISPLMLKGLSEYVIVGHSERRAYFHETDETINKKLSACFDHDLKPILCVGESLDQREAGETHAFVSGQVNAALEGFNAEQMKNVVIAYEPIWAIGTGKAATPQDAVEVINETIRTMLVELFDDSVAEAMRILYGGSVKPGNAASFFTLDGVDGALVGGASLQADSFAAIVEAAI